MRFFLILIGALLFATDAFALTAPARPTVISTKYVEGVLTHIETFLLGAAGSPPASGSCTPIEATKAEAETARNLRSIFFDVQAAIGEPARDLERSACFVSDAEALERYLRDLFDLALTSAASCDYAAQGHYETAISYVWSRLYSLRRLGLDPRVQAPVAGDEVETIGAAPQDDDLLCPYHSAYALPVFDAGCQLPLLPGTSSSALQREMQVIDSILQTSAKIGQALPLLQSTVARILASAAAFVTDKRGVQPFPPPPLPPPPAPLPVSFTNAGEAGCLGWPSDVGGNVSAEGIPLQNFFPMVLTRDLAEVMAFLKEREKDSWFEYIAALEEEIAQGESEGGNSYGGFVENVRKVNREHIGVESFSILAIRDPQKRMERAANFLHEGTREFTRLAVALPGDPSLPEGPPLRAFAAKYASFLSRICVNRGCAERLKRTVELSLRDECFSSFLMHLFFQGNPTASTLPACRALYAGS